MALVEALAAGIPVISSRDTGAGLDIIQDKYNGLLLNELNQNEIADKMQYCIEHRTQISKLRENARSSVTQYDVTAGAKEFENLIYMNE